MSDGAYDEYVPADDRKIGYFIMEIKDINLSILGSTGSIGTQSLDVARAAGINITALAARRSIKLLEEQIREFKPKIAAVMDEDAAKELKIKIADTDTKVLSGMEGFEQAAAFEDCNTVLNSVVGMVGLRPTMAAVCSGKRLALANKETLVAGGELVMNAVKEHNTVLTPVDSEHSAIFQCLQGSPGKGALKKIILTASGGPFFGKSRQELENVTPQQALKHPNWSMGAKITIDSATLMNKGLEVIEAAWLFDVSVDDIEVVVHRESIIHSAVEFCDNSVIAQLGVPDMRIPIQYALTWPQRMTCPVKPLSLTEVGKLTFFEPDTDTFRCLEICKEAMRRGGLAPAAANGANEAAVALFLDGKIGFNDISRLVGEAMQRQAVSGNYTLEDVFMADSAAREYVRANA